MNSIFERILYGLKTVNDNVIALDAKVTMLLDELSVPENEPNDAFGSDGIESINI